MTVEMDVLRKLKERNDKKDFKKGLSFDYGGSTVFVNGKLVMENGKIIDKEWWESKINKAWRRKGKYKSKSILGGIASEPRK